MKYIGQKEFPHQNPLPKRAVLLCNLGTPEASTPRALRKYLRQFLSDPRVIEVNPWLWKVILNCFILPFRPRNSAAMYQKVWTPEGSPLLLHSLAQQEALQTRLGPDVLVELAMCYGGHSVDDAVARMKAQDVREVVVLPLYPQYCAATTAATFDAVAKVYMGYRWLPQLHFVHGYHKEPRFIEALKASIERHVQAHGMPDKLIFSYHGTPKTYQTEGDPYSCFCLQNTRMVREALGWSEDQVMSTFQSRFGRAEWLQPYTDITLEKLAQEGVQHVAVICPGFASDCLETLEEIDQEARESFLDYGGQTFHYIAALNSEQDHIELFESLVNRAWLQPEGVELKRDLSQAS
jgi:ferrochelatase